MEATKPCKQCEKPKLLTDFYRHKSTPDKRMYICIECYAANQQEYQRQEQERAQERERERERQEQQQQEQQQREAARHASIAANKVCPRCKQLRTDGQLWPDGHLYFSRFCEECTNHNPHSIYTLTCPLLGLVRYVGITTQSLNRRLQQHMDTGKSGTEYKQYWIDDLRAKGLKPLIALIDEAANEREAKTKESRYIYHHIQQGCPLVNLEVMNSQLVLDVQNSVINFLEANEEEVGQVFHRSSFEERRELDYQREYRSVPYQKQRWVNRHKCVYIIYNAKPITLQWAWAGRGTSIDTLRREWRLRYDWVLTSDELSTDREARETILQQVTEALFYTEGDRILDDLLAHDCQSLLARGVPIAYEYYTVQSFQRDYGTLVSVESIKRTRGRSNWTEYPYGKAIMHPASYSVSPERCLVRGCVS